MSIALDKVDIFTQALNTSFVNGYNAVAEPAPIEKAITEVKSAGRVENYPWLFPPPLLHQWKGYRQYAKLGETNYRVPNVTYTAEFEVLFEDLEDDQVGGFKLQSKHMGEAAKLWSGIQSLITLAAGQTTLCFDGTNFFATAHTVGTGNNIVAATTAGNDSVTHAMAVLVLTNRVVRPLLWQLREPAKFQTDAGTIEAEKNRVIRNFVSLRGAACYGFWWDAILVKFANTPTVAEVQTALGTVNARFRGFTYPVNLPSDVAQYPHGQTSFTDKTLLTVCSTKIEHIVRQALTLSVIAQTENFYKGFSDLIASGYLDAVV